METIAKSDIFFFITSIAVVIFTVISVIAGYYIIRTLQNIRTVSESIKRTALSAESNIEEISERVSESALFSFIFGKKHKNSHHHSKKK